jgi:putative membrane protein
MIVRHFYGRPGLGYRGPGLFRVLILVVLVALLVVAITRLVYMRRAHTARAQRWQHRQWGPPGGGPMHPNADPALHELRLRYARGELSRDEFLERSRDLGGPDGTVGPPPR